jgi:hypothetical protein
MNTKLKNDKACGEDEIINEYIKSTSNRFIFMRSYLTLSLIRA